MMVVGKKIRSKMTIILFMGKCSIQNIYIIIDSAYLILEYLLLGEGDSCTFINVVRYTHIQMV